MPRKPNAPGRSFSYREARDRLLQSIVDQGLNDGDLLPSMRNLADSFTDGRLKPVRMAVTLLGEEGVLVTRHGQGVFVRDAKRARVLANAHGNGLSEADDDEIGDDVSPFAYRNGRRTLVVALCESHRYFRRTWEAIADRFTAMSERITVQPVFYRLSDSTAGEIAGADLVQIQAHNRKRLPSGFEAVPVEQIVDRETRDAFIPSLYPDKADQARVTGLPVSAVAHCAAVNEHKALRKWPEIPDAWKSFDDYADFILELRRLAPRRIRAVVHASNNMLFHLSLAGLAVGNDVEGLPRFTTHRVRDLLTRFGRVFCRSDCYTGDWADAALDAYQDTLLRESHTYDAILRDAETGLQREFVPLPTEDGGRVPVISHLFCVNRECAALDDAEAFLTYLASPAVADALLAVGHISGRRDALPRIHRVIRHAIEHGRLIEDACPRLLDLFAATVNPEVRRWQRGELNVDELCEILEGARQTCLTN